MYNADNMFERVTDSQRKFSIDLYSLLAEKEKCLGTPRRTLLDKFKTTQCALTLGSLTVSSYETMNESTIFETFRHV